jgi:hypothetical protein
MVVCVLVVVVKEAAAVRVASEDETMLGRARFGGSE